MEDWNEEFLSYEVEKELSKHDQRDPNLDGTPSKKSGCAGLILKLIIGIIIFRLILEILGLFV
jgi:hypothetical protein